MDRVWVANRDGSQMRTVFLSSEMQLGTGSIGQIAWSPDGKSVAVAMETGIVYLIDVNCAAGSTGCDASSRKRIDAIPVHWLPNFYPQWAGEKVAR